MALLGYPADGAFDAEPGRIGETARISTDDAYGRGPVSRTITSLRGKIEHGDSGGPAVDAQGAVQSTMFAARVGETGGYGVPAEVVRQALSQARHRGLDRPVCTLTEIRAFPDDVPRPRWCACRETKEAEMRATVICESRSETRADR